MMPNDLIPWTLAIGASAALAIWGRHPRRMSLHWVFKPVTTLLIFGLLARHAPAGATRNFAAGALLLSTGGDVLLMLSSRWFMPGLAAFMLALLMYGVAFSLGVPWRLTSLGLALVPLAVLGLALKPLLSHLTGRRRVAIAIYGLVLAGLAWRLLVRYESPAIGPVTYASGVAGALLFVAGDTLLAYRRFAHARIPYALELGTYYGAQVALALTLVMP